MSVDGLFRFQNQNIYPRDYTRVQDSKGERPLGLTVDNQLTWSEYLYGEQWREKDNAIGLIPQLNKIVGLLSKLVNMMQKEKFKLLYKVSLLF